MSWATASDLQDYMKAAGMIAMTPTAQELLLDYQGALDSAVDRWNDATLYWPFLSTGVDEARRFSPPGMGLILSLNGGLVAITSMMVDATYTSSGTAYTNLEHFRLLPRDAAQKKAPWTHIEFLWSPWNVSDGEIEITGKWGYCLNADLPARAKRGVLAYAALELEPQIKRALSQGTIRWTEGDVTRQYANLADSVSDWQKVATDAAAGYRRTRIG